MNLRVVVALVLAPVAAAAGLASWSARAHQAAPTAHRLPVALKPVVEVSPNTDLVGGERVHVTLRGFPADTRVGLWECPSSAEVGRSGCMGKSTELSINRAGSAAGTLVAQPTAQVTWNTPLKLCTTRCVVAAVQTLKALRPPSTAPVTATESVSFRPNATRGLADTSIVTLSWVSPEVGFALADQPCTKGTCAVVAKTADGGRHWEELPSTRALAHSSPGCNHHHIAVTECVDGITFASPTVGYLFGPAMFMTTDGGRSWQVVPSEEVTLVAVEDGQVFRLVYSHTGCPGACTTSLQSATVGSSNWQTVIGHVAFDEVPRYQVLTSGSDVYVVAYGNLAGGAGTAQAYLYRSVDGGATFQTLTDPCLSAFPALHVLTTLAAAPGGVLQGICTPRDQSGSKYLLTSTDAGTTWEPPRAIEGVVLQSLAAASATTIAVTSEPGGTRTEDLLLSTDGGASWSTVASDSSASQTFDTGFDPSLGFTTSMIGWWVATPQDVWTTLDGGSHWTKRPTVRGSKWK